MKDVYVKAATAGDVLPLLPAWMLDGAGGVLPVSARHVADWDILNEQGVFLANFRFGEDADADALTAALGGMVLVPAYPKRVFA